MLVDRRRGIPGQDPLQLHQAGGPHGGQAAEFFQQLLFSFRADARDPIELRVAQSFAPELPVIGDGKAVGLLLDVSNQGEDRLIVVNADLAPLGSHQSPGPVAVILDHNQAIFALIGNIQEETHRFAITYHRQLRSKRLSYSELDGIPGIGPKRKQELLKKFGSLTAMRAASLMELERVLPRDAARAVYKYFHEEDEL